MTHSVSVLANEQLAVDNLLDRLFPKRRIDRVLLVNPPDADAKMFRYDTAARRRYTNYPPYGLMVIARNLERVGVETRILNLNHEILTAVYNSDSSAGFDFDAVWQIRLRHELASFAPDLVGVTCMFTMTHRSLKAVCGEIKSLEFPVAIGGVHVSNDVDRVLDDLEVADIAFLREADHAIQEFVSVVRGVSLQDNLAQIVMVDDKARYRFDSLCQPSTEEMDVIPAYELIDLPAHSQCGTIGAFYCFKPPDTTFASILSNRGCRAQCSFCSVRNFNGSGVRQRSISSVVDELELLESKYGVGHVMWLDDDLLKDHGRAIGLFNEMVRRGLTLTWDATNGVLASSCTPEVIAAAAESGCIALNIGMESGNPDILRTIRKPATVEIFLRASEVLQHHEEIHSSVFLMIGFPGETMSMIFDTVTVAQEMGLDWYRVSQLQPLPNTPIYDAMIAQGLIQPVGSNDLRFMGGAFGKQTEIEQGLRLSTSDFAAAFSSIPMQAVPTPDQLTDIWFFMNYHLNFRRIFEERRPVKMRQLEDHLQVLADVISPENGFALYFLGYLQSVSGRGIDCGLIKRLASRLETSSYWRDRFDAFGLAFDDLENDHFSDADNLRLVPVHATALDRPYHAVSAK